MPKTIGRLKARVLLHTIIFLLIITLLILTSATFADGNQLLYSLKDLKDPGSLAVKLQDTRAAVSKPIAAQLSTGTQQLLSEYDGVSRPAPALQKALLDDLNRLIQAAPLYDAQHLRNIKLSEQTQALLARTPQSGGDLLRFEPLPSGRPLPLRVSFTLRKTSARRFQRDSDMPREFKTNTARPRKPPR